MEFGPREPRYLRGDDQGAREHERASMAMLFDPDSDSDPDPDSDANRTRPVRLRPAFKRPRLA